MVLSGKLCRFISFRKLGAGFWFSQKSCADLFLSGNLVLIFGSLRKVVLIYGSFRKVVRVEARFSESCESGDPLLRKVGGNLLI